MDFNSAAVIASAALFEALAPRNEPEVPANDVNNGLSAGMAAAAAIYKATRDSTDAPTRLSSPHHEGLQVRMTIGYRPLQRETLPRANDAEPRWGRPATPVALQMIVLPHEA